jgi:hypothetical protein
MHGPHGEMTGRTQAEWDEEWDSLSPEEKQALAEDYKRKRKRRYQPPNTASQL